MTTPSTGTTIGRRSGPSGEAGNITSPILATQGRRPLPPLPAPVESSDVGPRSLADVRRHARERFEAASLPSSAVEVWRYSRIDALDLTRYTPVSGTLPVTVPAAPVDPAAEIVVRDGTVETIRITARAAAQGLQVRRASEIDDALEGPAPRDGDAHDAIVDLALALAHDAVVVDVPAGAVIAGTIVVVNILGAPDAVIATRLIVRLGADSEAELLERVVGADVASLILPLAQVSVGEGSRLRFVTVQELGAQSWQLAHQHLVTGRDATLRSMNVALGGDYARVRTDAVITAQGGFNELLAVYFGEGTQMHDFRTLQHHIAPRTTSELLFKGAVEDTAQSVYSGLIRIGKDARGTVANQTNRNLLLSPGASAESVPNLEIENNDVKCSHASAVGPVDDDLRYYLELRGVPPEDAERLIVIGFFQDVLDRSPVKGLAEQLGQAVAAKFARRSA